MKIKLLALGGTISAKGMNRLDLKDYQSGLITPEFFVKDLPELSEIARVDVETMDGISSTAIEITHWLTLREKIIHYVTSEQYDGIVITHGTSTLEETAYFLHLTVPTDKPIVLIGAQRPYTALSSDAQLNILHGVRVAANENSMGKGVLVVLNDEIFCAREVTKINTYRVDAFGAGQLGHLGFVDVDGTVQYYRSPTRKHTIHSLFSQLDLQHANLPTIEIVYSYAGANGDLIQYIATSGRYQGIVIAGTGAGLVSPQEEKALEKALENGLIIVRSSRVVNGRVVDINKYQHPAIISGDNLLPQKARILLMLSLVTTKQPSDIQDIFNTY